MRYQTSEFRNGLKVELDGSPYVMVYFQFVKPGKGTAFTRTKLKNMLNGNVIERPFRTGETVDAAEVEEFKAQEALNHLSNDIMDILDGQGVQEDLDALDESLEELQWPDIDFSIFYETFTYVLILINRRF